MREPLDEAALKQRIGAAVAAADKEFTATVEGKQLAAVPPYKILWALLSHGNV